ncbi:hypothetical protein NERG_01175, partial [Nematocida ausubeli]
MLPVGAPDPPNIEDPPISLSVCKGIPAPPESEGCPLKGFDHLECFGCQIDCF